MLHFLFVVFCYIFTFIALVGPFWMTENYIIQRIKDEKAYDKTKKNEQSFFFTIKEE